MELIIRSGKAITDSIVMGKSLFLFRHIDTFSRFVTGPKSDGLPSQIFNSVLLFSNIAWAFIVMPCIMSELVLVDGIMVEKHWFHGIFLPVFLLLLGLVNHSVTLIC